VEFDRTPCADRHTHARTHTHTHTHTHTQMDKAVNEWYNAASVKWEIDLAGIA